MASPEFDENSLYAQILRQRDQRIAREQFQQPREPFDLDKELRKLNEIKRKREEELKSKRDEANRRKLEEMNKIFFKQEMRTMKQKQFISKEKYSYYQYSMANNAPFLFGNRGKNLEERDNKRTESTSTSIEL